MIIAQLSIAPVGKDIDLSVYVRSVLETLQKEPVHCETNAMATVIEASDMNTLLTAVQKAHETLFTLGVQRVITELKIDDRRDKNATIVSKINAVQPK